MRFFKLYRLKHYVFIYSVETCKYTHNGKEINEIILNSYDKKNYNSYDYEIRYMGRVEDLEIDLTKTYKLNFSDNIIYTPKYMYET
jgi:hypothetical protein